MNSNFKTKTFLTPGSTMPGCSAAAASTVELFISRLERCTAIRDLFLGRILHSLLIKSSLAFHTLLCNRIVDMYAKSSDLPSALVTFKNIPQKNQHSYNTLLSAHARAGQFSAARQLFDEMPQRNIVSFNTMISSLSNYGFNEEALDFFRSMRKSSFEIVMDKFTVVGVAAACAGLENLKALQQVHVAVIVSGLKMNIIMFNVMIDAYGKCGDADGSHNLFDELKERDVVSWTSLISAYARTDRLEEAQGVFGRMPERNVVSWTALISGHEQSGQEETALKLFQQMVDEGFQLTESTLVSVLSACARMGLVGHGKQLHGFMIRRCIGVDSFNLFVHNALIDMYAKCSNMLLATAVFDRMLERDCISWNSLVTGFAQNGDGRQSLATFKRMVLENIKPTDVTFLAVLSACSHTGLVSEGHEVLKMMKGCGIVPRPEHYAAFIDALGRKHQLKEALEFLEGLTDNGTSDLVGAWGALLGACQIHGNSKIANKAAQSVFALDPNNGARYVALSNVYSAAGKWEDARQAWAIMKEKGLRKKPGCSWIEVRSWKHMFVAEDKSHFETKEIYRMLETVTDEMKEIKYPDCSMQEIYYPPSEESNFIHEASV